MTHTSSRNDVATLDSSRPSPAAPRSQAQIPGLDLRTDRLAADLRGRDSQIDNLRLALASGSPEALEVAEEGLRTWPSDPEMLLLAALTALAGNLPERALALLKRYGKRYVPGKAATLLTALAFGQQLKFIRAWTMLHAAGLDTDRAALAWFVGDTVMADWLYTRLREIRVEKLRRASHHSPAVDRGAKQPTARPPAHRAPRPNRDAGHDGAIGSLLPAVADLPRLEARLEIAFELVNPDAIDIVGLNADPDPTAFLLRGELARLGLFEGFDELLCLPALQGVEAHWYQVETVRKVLKQYRGRVLLADEVGLGKTIEAGMVLKEYILRGMAERILILTPASLVGQWHDEMASKFGIDCATSHDPLLRSDPAVFWAQPRVIASIGCSFHTRCPG